MWNTQFSSVYIIVKHQVQLSLPSPRGSPMAIGMIGAILRKNNREAKWKAVAQRLERKHSVSSMELHAAVNDWNYQHPTLNASMELSVESLPLNMKQYFELFVVFDHDTLISGDALETIFLQF